MERIDAASAKNYPLKLPHVSAPTRILVTGASGVVGRRVIQELQTQGPAHQVITFSGDVSSRSDVAKSITELGPIHACIHLAAIVPVALAVSDPIRAYNVNALGSGFLIDEVTRRYQGAYVLHCSTSHVYAPSKVPLCEGAAVGPVSTYGRSKLAAEHVATDVAAANEAKLGIARIFSLWAEDQHESFLYPSLVRRFATHGANQTVRIPGGNNVRDFLHVRDVARLLVSAFHERFTGVMNVASGVGTSVREFAQIHAPPGVTVESDDVKFPTAIVADVTRMREVIGD